MSSHKRDNDFEELARHLADLDDEAFREFSDTFGPRLRAFFLRKGLAQSDAEDLAVTCVTDIALNVSQHYKPMGKGSFEAWVFKLAYRALVDWFRARRGPQYRTADFLAQVPCAEMSPPDMEIVWAVQDAIDQLSQADQEIIESRDLGPRLSFEEIGERLGISAATARVRHHRALLRIMQVLELDPRTRYLKRQDKS